MLVVIVTFQALYSPASFQTLSSFVSKIEFQKESFIQSMAYRFLTVYAQYKGISSWLSLLMFFLTSTQPEHIRHDLCYPLTVADNILHKNLRSVPWATGFITPHLRISTNFLIPAIIHEMLYTKFLVIFFLFIIFLFFVRFLIQLSHSVLIFYISCLSFMTSSISVWCRWGW